MLDNENTPKKLADDEDIEFDMHEKSNISGSISPDKQHSGSVDKEAEISNNEFRPLTDQEKQPKLHDYERIKEMNRRTAIDD